MPFERSHAPRVDDLNAIFNDFTIESLISVGPTGAVYKALWNEYNLPVAIKVLPRRYFKDSEFYHRFCNEMQLAQRAEHPALVKVYGYGSVGENPFVAMEYLEGETLRDKIEQGLIDNLTALRLAKEICQALSHAHKVGYVHSNLQPSNILILKDGTVKVIDFGLARCRDLKRHPIDRRTWGLAGFDAPELTENRSLVDNRCDIYSIGALLSYMTTSYTPDLLVVDGLHNKGMLRELYPIVFKCVRRNPEHRYQSVDEMLEDINLHIHSQRETATETDKNLFTINIFSKEDWMELFPKSGKTTEYTSEQKREIFNFETSKRSDHCRITLGNRYQVGQCISNGRVGVIYHAHDLNLNTDVALHIFFRNDSFSWGEAYRSIVCDLTNLDHRLLPRILDAGIFDGGAYLVTQIIDGINLRLNIQQEEMSIKEALNMSRQLLDTLSYTAKKGYHNQALCPHSIMVHTLATGKRLYYITDTGHGRISALLHALNPVSLNADAALIAPEDLEGINQGERTTLFIFGQILFTALASDHPYSTLTPEQVYQNYKNADPLDLREFRSDVPDEFTTWLSKCINPNYRKRWRTLTEALQEMPSPTTPHANNVR